jgi:hypothetical protein
MYTWHILVSLAENLAYILKPMIRMQNLAWTAEWELLNISPDAYNLSPPCTFQPTL